MSTVGKLVVLKLDGDFEQSGFHVALEIGPEQSRPSIEVPGKLPPNPELVEILNEWRQTYRSLGMLSRISPQKIIYGGSVNRQKECQRLADDLRDRLNAWLESKSFQAIDRRLRAALSPDDSIRVLIRTHNHDLHHLPWHFWDFVGQYPQAEIALSACWSASISPPRKTVSRGKVRILAILGNSEGINVESDRHLLKSLPNADVTFLSEPRREDISDQLWDQPWDILFFAGHSQTEDERGKIYINSEKESLTIAQLQYGLEQAIANGLQLAIFNSCDGLGLAYDLEQLHLPQLIVMREPVPDQVAQKFVKYFLKAFAAGDSLYLATRKARQRLYGLESDFPCASWLPVICQNPTEVPPTWQALRGIREADRDERTPNRRTFPTKQTLRRELLVVLLASVVITGLLIGARWQGKLQTWELQAFDFLMRQRPIEKPDSRLLVIRATEQDLERLKEPTLSDNTILQLLKKLEPYKPQAIGLDIFREKAEGKGHAALIDYLEQENNIFPACFTSNPNEIPQLGNQPPSPTLSARMSFADAIFDSDWVVRRHLLKLTPDLTSPCQASSALSFTLALNYLKQKGTAPQQVIEHQSFQLGKAVFRMVEPHIGGYQWLDPKEDLGGDQILLNYRPYRDLADTVRETTLIDALATLDNPKSNSYTNFISDKIVLIGYDDRKGDYQTTPYGKLSGVFIHAHMVSQILSAAYGERSLLWWFPWWGDILWVWGWSLIGGLLVWKLRTPLFWSLAGVGAFSLLYGLCYFVLIQGGWLPLVPSVLVLLLTSSSILVYQTLRDQQRLSQ